MRLSLCLLAVALCVAYAVSANAASVKDGGNQPGKAALDAANERAMKYLEKVLMPTDTARMDSFKAHADVVKVDLPASQSAAKEAEKIAEECKAAKVESDIATAQHREAVDAANGARPIIDSASRLSSVYRQDYLFAESLISDALRDKTLPDDELLKAAAEANRVLDECVDKGKELSDNTVKTFDAVKDVISHSKEAQAALQRAIDIKASNQCG